MQFVHKKITKKSANTKMITILVGISVGRTFQFNLNTGWVNLYKITQLT